MIVAALAATLVASAAPAATPLSLPGGADGIGFDDLVFSAELHRVLVPAGRTGLVDLVEPGSHAVERVEGFSRTEARTRGHGDGTTSADAGGGRIFAIDRTERTVAVVDPTSRRIVARATLHGPPDYVRWVDATHEVWVTEPAREVIEILRLEGGATPALTSTAEIAVPAGPESLVVDSGRGRAYTNTFGDTTLALDVRARTVSARWSNGCRAARGIAIDAGRQLVFVGCDEGKAVALDARDGSVLGTARTGGGVDGIAYDPARGHLYVPAGDAATLTVLGVGARGALEVLGALPAAAGAHCAAADDGGDVYVCDPAEGRLLVMRDSFPTSR
jgi:DNA-binding beta-propeller fold protein YncE